MGTGECLLVCMFLHFIIDHKAGSAVFWVRHFTVNLNQALYYPSHISDLLVRLIWEIKRDFKLHIARVSQSH